MRQYKYHYLGEVLAEWEYNGEQFEARMDTDGFGYICKYADGMLSIMGNAGFDYFLVDKWLPLAQELRLHE